MSEQVFNVGDRVRVTQVKWVGATPEELATVGAEGTVVPSPFGGRAAGLFVRVELDEKPEWWDEDYAIPFVADELELVK